MLSGAHSNLWAFFRNMSGPWQCCRRPTEPFSLCCFKMTIQDAEGSVFLRRMQKAIFVLGFELGLLLQGSTLPIQYVALSYVPDPSTQLFLSLVWGYMLAATGLLLFCICQRLVRAWLRLEASEDEETPPTTTKGEPNDNYHFHLVDLQCYFIQGSVVGVFVSWCFVDRLLNYQTRVLYGGIMFLVSLLIFLRQIWNGPGCCLEWADNQLDLQGSSSMESESSSPDRSKANHPMVHVL